MPLHETRFAAPVVDLNVAEGGPPGAPPLLLLHGGGGRWQYLGELAEALSTTYHVFAPDLRGHGKSGRVPGGYKLDDYIPDIKALIEQRVGEPPVVFGHSMGGEVAVMLAARHPELVLALIVGDAPLTVEQHATEDPEHRARNELWHSLVGRPVNEIERALKQTPLEGRTAEEVMGPDHPWFAMHALTLHQLDQEMLSTVLAGPELMLEGYDPFTLLPAIQAPTLLVQADPNGPLGGGVMRDDEVALGLRLIPNAQHVRIDGVGHPLNDLPKVLAVVMPFLNEISASAQRRSRATG
jgi:pimeloyl-ACP methyl ester carboxylesterase